MILSQQIPTRVARRMAALIGVLGVSIGLSACNGTSPAVIVMQVTTTPDPRVIQITVTNTSAQAAGTAAATTNTIPATASAATPAVTSLPVTSAPVTAGALIVPSASVSAAATIGGTAAATIAATVVPTQVAGTPTVSAAMPTETHSQLIIAHESFEHGYMFWISVYKQDWVLLPAANAPASSTPPTSGVWMIFPDTFVDGEQEVDPALIPPSALLFQPRRGFGKLWRTNKQVHDALGWATTQEFGLTTSYAYQPGGYIDSASGQWVPGPGTHFLVTISRETFAFHEPAPGQQFGTWEKVG